MSWLSAHQPLCVGTAKNLVTSQTSAQMSLCATCVVKWTYLARESSHCWIKKTTESNVSEGDKTKFLSTTSHVSRLDASTSGTLYKHEEEREIFQAAISTPVVNSRVFDVDVASPAGEAKAYMGSRPAKVFPSPLQLGSQPPRQDSAVLNNTTTLLRTPITSAPPRTEGSFKGYENRLTTPRSQGRTTWHIHPITEGLQHLAKKVKRFWWSLQRVCENNGLVHCSQAGFKIISRGNKRVCIRSKNQKPDLHLFHNKSLLACLVRFTIPKVLDHRYFILHAGWEQCVVHREINVTGFKF